MKGFKIKIIVLLIALLVASCGESNKRNTDIKTKVEEPVMIVKTTMNKPGDKSTAIKSNLERLSELPSLTEAAFNAWMPKSIVGLPITSVSNNAPKDVAMFDIIYATDEKKLRLKIVDGAGERGTQLIGPAHNIAYQNVDQKIPMGYIKTVTENGIVAKERYAKVNEEYQLEFLYEKRLYIQLTTNNVGREKTWQAVLDFHFKELIDD